MGNSVVIGRLWTIWKPSSARHHSMSWGPAAGGGGKRGRAGPVGDVGKPTAGRPHLVSGGGAKCPPARGPRRRGPNARRSRRRGPLPPFRHDRLRDELVVPHLVEVGV